MNEQDFTARIKSRLDESSEELPVDVRNRLQAARQQALTQMRQMRDQRKGAERPANAFLQNWRLSVPAFALVMLAVGYLVFHLFADSPEQAIHALEAEMLNHELPPHAFIDEGFQQWLKRDSKP